MSSHGRTQKKLCQYRQVKDNHKLFRVIDIKAGPASSELYKAIPLVPVGEWKIKYLLSKNINNSTEEILTTSDFYEIKPTSAVEF